MISTAQANRLKDHFKRSGHIFKVINERMKEKNYDQDELFRVAVKLAGEEYDAIFNDLMGMLNGKGNGNA